MTTGENLARLKAAYAAWDQRQAASLDVWRELMDKDFTLKSVDEKTAPSLAFARDRDSREEALDYLRGIFEHWTMIYYRPETFVSEGDHTAVFGTCAYTHKVTGKAAQLPDRLPVALEGRQAGRDDRGVRFGGGG